jgi:predicted transcriptional regulator
MGWEGVAAIASVTVTLALGLLTYARGSKSDQALNIATNVQSTYVAQASLIDDLQAEVARTHNMLVNCEKSGREIRSKYDEAKRLILVQEREIDNLKRVQAEHEITIAQHQRKIDTLTRPATRRTRKDD